MSKETAATAVGKGTANKSAIKTPGHFGRVEGKPGEGGWHKDSKAVGSYLRKGALREDTDIRSACEH